MNDNLIKLHIAFDNEDGIQGEWLWARQISEGHAKLANIPFCADFGKGDLVSFDEDMEIIKLLERATNTFHASYPCDPYNRDIVKEVYSAVRDYLLRYDIYIEGFVPGLLAMSVPIDVDETQLNVIMAGCPYRLSLHGGNDGNTAEQQGDS